MKGARGPARQPGKRRMRRFQKARGLESLTAEGRAMCVQDEATVMADVRLRKGGCAPKKKRAACKRAGNHAKAMQSGLPAADGGGCFEATNASPRTSS